MNKKIVIALSIAILVLAAGIGYLLYSLHTQKQANADMKTLTELDKKDMENEYEQFAQQYSEMKTQINNDSIVAQLTQEQLKTQRLLQELRQTKSTDAREITRLKRELATVRSVLRSYVLEIDSLNRLNTNLRNENTAVRGQLAESNKQIEGLSSEKASLSQRVAIAAQLDATAIQMQLLNKRGKSTDKMKNCKRIAVSFNIARNVTATNGTRQIYIRIGTPTGDVLKGDGTFLFEDKSIAFSMHRAIEYTGEETSVTAYWPVGEFLSAGTYTVSIFADGSMIGSRSVSFK